MGAAMAMRAWRRQCMASIMASASGDNVSIARRWRRALKSVDGHGEIALATNDGKSEKAKRRIAYRHRHQQKRWQRWQRISRRAATAAAWRKSAGSSNKRQMAGGKMLNGGIGKCQAERKQRKLLAASMW